MGRLLFGSGGLSSSLNQAIVIESSLDRVIIIVIGSCDYHYHRIEHLLLSLDRVIIIALLLDRVNIVWIRWITIIIEPGDYHYHRHGICQN